MSDSDAARPAETEDRPAKRDRAPNTLLNGLIGGVVAVVFGVAPFSPVLGGVLGVDLNEAL